MHPVVAAAYISSLHDRTFWGIPLKEDDLGEYPLDGDTFAVIQGLAEQA